MVAVLLSFGACGCGYARVSQTKVAPSGPLPQLASLSEATSPNWRSDYIVRVFIYADADKDGHSETIYDDAISTRSEFSLDDSTWASPTELVIKLVPSESHGMTDADRKSVLLHYRFDGENVQTIDGEGEKFLLTRRPYRDGQPLPLLELAHPRSLNF